MNEIDTPWFDVDWLADHPDFPLASGLVHPSHLDNKESPNE